MICIRYIAIIIILCSNLRKKTDWKGDIKWNENVMYLLVYKYTHKIIYWRNGGISFMVICYWELSYFVNQPQIYLLFHFIFLFFLLIIIKIRNKNKRDWKREHERERKKREREGEKIERERERESERDIQKEREREVESEKDPFFISNWNLHRVPLA